MEIELNAALECVNGLLDDFQAKGELLQKMAALEQRDETNTKVAEEMAKRAPSVVDTLVKLGFLDESQRAAALEAAKDPLKVLDSLEKTAKTVVAIQKQASVPQTLGKGEVLKEAGVSNTAVGLDPSSRIKSVALDEANRRFLTAIGF
jgi:hypothetical protein